VVVVGVVMDKTHNRAVLVVVAKMERPVEEPQVPPEELLYLDRGIPAELAIMVVVFFGVVVVAVAEALGCLEQLLKEVLVELELDLI
jgi:hypothetical protein